MSSGVPDVSVVMSVYNGARYLPVAVESILSQDEVDFELIIVNDGSTDESGRALRDYARRDARIRVLEQENAGLTRALIRGCAEALQRRTGNAARGREDLRLLRRRISLCLRKPAGTANLTDEREGNAHVT